MKPSSKAYGNYGKLTDEQAASSLHNNEELQEVWKFVCPKNSPGEFEESSKRG